MCSLLFSIECVLYKILTLSRQQIDPAAISAWRRAGLASAKEHRRSFAHAVTSVPNASATFARSAMFHAQGAVKKKSFCALAAVTLAVRAAPLVHQVSLQFWTVGVWESGLGLAARTLSVYATPPPTHGALGKVGV